MSVTSITHSIQGGRTRGFAARGLRMLLAVTVTAIATVAVAPSALALANVPAHRVVTPTCGGLVDLSVSFAMPSMGSIMPSTTSNREKVWFTANLQRWNGSSFVNVDNSMPWAWADINPAGTVVLGWYNSGIDERTFALLGFQNASRYLVGYAGSLYTYHYEPPGYYRIEQQVYWTGSGQYSPLEYSGWCQLG